MVVVDSDMLNVAGISVTDTGKLSVTARPEVDPSRITNENVFVPSLIGSLITVLVMVATPTPAPIP